MLGKDRPPPPKKLALFVTTSIAKWSPCKLGDGFAPLAMTVSSR